MPTHHIMCHSFYIFHTEFSPANPVVLLPLMQARRSRIMCCSSWMLAQSTWETFGPPMKGISISMASLISRTGAFGERKIHMLQYHHPRIPKNVWFVPRFLPKDSFGHIFMLSNYWRALYGHLWSYKTLWRTSGEPRDSCKTVTVHIARMKSLISSMNISIILSSH